MDEIHLLYVAVGKRWVIVAPRRGSIPNHLNAVIIHL